MSETESIYCYFRPEVKEYYDRLNEHWEYDLSTIDGYQQFERIWKSFQQPNVKLSEVELLKIFQEGRALLIKADKHRIKECEFWLKRNSLHLKEIKHQRLDLPYDQQWVSEWQIQVVETENKAFTKLIRQAEWHIKFLQGRVKPSKKGITDEDIYQAKQIKIETLYSDRLRKSGNRLFGKCPFHQEKSASFVVYTTQNSFHCFGCEANGSVVDYVMKRQNLDFLSAVKYLINK